MKRLLLLTISLLLTLLLSMGVAFAEVTKGDPANLNLYVLADLGDEDHDDDSDSSDEDEDRDDDEDEYEDEEDMDEDLDEDEDKDELDEDEDLDEDENEDEEENDKIEYIIDGYHVEIKDGKIEIKGLNGESFEIKDGKIEYKSILGKIEIKEEEVEVKGGQALLDEFYEKLLAYEAMIGAGIDLGANFNDTEDHWAEPVIDELTAINLFNGFGDGTFRPDDSITRAETVVLVMRIASGEEDEFSEDQADMVFEVDEDFPDWAKASILKAAEKNILNLNNFNSQTQANRAEVAVLLAKALGFGPVNADSNPFKDTELISEDDMGYILSLYKAGIIQGTPEGFFNPENSIKRDEMAAMLKRSLTAKE